MDNRKRSAREVFACYNEAEGYFVEEAIVLNYGYLAAAAAYCIWGLLPIYWKFLNHLSPFYILSARIVFSFVFCVFLVAVKRCWPDIKAELKQPGRMLRILIASLLITVNWGTYIAAVNTGHIIDSSMGYYLNPLLVILVSTCFFKEKLSRMEWLAIGLAATGVLLMIFRFGQIPWISLILASTFAVYGAVKKTLHLDGLTSLTLETACIFPVFTLALFWMESQGQGAAGSGAGTLLLVILSGVVTAVPLLLYGTAVKLIPFSAVGFFQYISPTISLILGVLLYHEAFTAEDFIVFLFIWAGLAVYLGNGIVSIWRERQKKRISADDVQ